MPEIRMVVLGDSVNWGQGLDEPDKYYSLVHTARGGDSQSCFVLAHSGATIGVGVETTGNAVNGEVPTSFPTIIQQCESFGDAPESVDIVLLNGGINDIDVRLILNPFTDSSDLHDMIRQYCFRDMETLLEKVIAKFSKPTARIVVTGYFPMLSSQSSFPHAPLFLAMHGVSVAPFLDLLGDTLLEKVVANCAQFYTQSSRMLEKAVNKTNQAAGGTPRVHYAQPPFTAANAALAPQAWLWGVNQDFSPQDPVRDARRAACDMFETDLVRRLSCHRASAGHPNVTGASRFADAILAAIG